MKKQRRTKMEEFLFNGSADYFDGWNHEEPALMGMSNYSTRQELNFRNKKGSLGSTRTKTKKKKNFLNTDTDPNIYNELSSGREHSIFI